MFHKKQTFPRGFKVGTNPKMQLQEESINLRSPTIPVQRSDQQATHSCSQGPVTQIIFIFTGAATMKIRFSFTFGVGGEQSNNYIRDS